MMIALMIAGVFAVLAGLLAIVYGFLLELSFGNTLILAGVIGVCSGMLVLAQAVVVRELKNLGRRLGPRTAAESRPRPVLAPVAPPMPPIQDQGEPVDAEPAAAPPWREEAASRDRMRQEPSPFSQSVPLPEEAAEPAPPPPRRRSLLFSSTVRKDRNQPPVEDVAPPDFQAPPADETGDAPPASFEDAWPGLERSRPPEAPQRRTSRPPSTFTETGAGAGAPERAPKPARSEDQPAVTVIKSGVVDGMAYSLYSDGSIEAQMPEGMMRFASIDELRAHLDQRS